MVLVCSQVKDFSRQAPCYELWASIIQEVPNDHTRAQTKQDHLRNAHVVVMSDVFGMFLSRTSVALHVIQVIWHAPQPFTCAPNVSSEF